MQLRQLARKEFRQEFSNHHLGALRKRLIQLRDLQDYRRRCAYSRQLEETDPVLPELEFLLEHRYAGIEFGEEMLEPLLATCRERHRNTKISSRLSQDGKKYYLDLLNEEDYDPSSPYMQFALQPRLLNTATRYFGQAPYLQSVELMWSRPYAGSPELTKSQLWHCDNNNDRHILKLFVYVTDVTNDNGPLTFLPAAESDRLPWYEGHYLDDDAIGRYVSLENRVQFTGSAGSAVMMDTANLYHFGSRCAKPRLTFVIHYNTGHGYLPRNGVHTQWAAQHSTLSDVQRLAIST
jgi:hypothetical protein